MTGYDLKRSGKDNSPMILSTLCGETPGGGQQVCSRHPEYLEALTTKLPEECVSLDGTTSESRAHRCHEKHALVRASA